MRVHSINNDKFKFKYLRNEMSLEEYNETKEETLEQFQELNTSLSKLKEGNLTLIDEVNGMQLAIRGI
jgi:hypothetical protein